MRRLVLACLLVVPLTVQAQQVDRTAMIVKGQVIMDSDVPLARTLKLVPLGDGSDDVILTGLENRILQLAEAARSTVGEPTRADIAARRAQWEKSLGADPKPLLAQVHMSDDGLTAWLRDDAKIQLYTDQVFGHRPDPPAEIENWIKDLRRRAGLK